VGLLKRILRPLRRQIARRQNALARLHFLPLDRPPASRGRYFTRGDGFRELIAGGGSCPSRNDFQLPEILRKEEIDWVRLASQPVKPLGYYQLRNVSLCGEGYVLKRGKVCYAPSIIPDYLREILEADPQRVLVPRKRAARKFARPALLLAIHDYNNYMHWWMELAPRIYPLWLHEPDLLKALAVVVPTDLSSWCKDTLITLYGIEASAFVTYDAGSEVLQCASAIIPSMMHTNFNFHPEAEGFYRYVIEKCRGRPVRVGRSGRLFLTRRHSAKGRILANIMEVEALAASLGFELIAPETLSWQDQVSLFANARIVAGEHGAAMKNLLFAPSDAVSVVINYINPSQATLAALKGQRCIILGVEGTTGGYGGPFTADMRRLKICLEHGLRLAGY
jgi:hypothetical protein